MNSTAYLSLAKGPQDEIAAGTELSNSQVSIQIWSGPRVLDPFSPAKWIYNI